MKNSLMKEKEINVKVNDIVSVQGNRGIVTEVIKGTDANGEQYTNVRVNFTGDLSKYGQYQNGIYGLYTVIK